MQHSRKNIVQPDDWWQAFAKAAARRGLTLSAWIGEIAKDSLPSKVADKLSERRPANRPKKDEEYD